MGPAALRTEQYDVLIFMSWIHLQLVEYRYKVFPFSLLDARLDKHGTSSVTRFTFEVHSTPRQVMSFSSIEALMH